MVKVLWVLGVAFASSWSAYGTALMRYPSASKTEIAFVAYDDLWVVPFRADRQGC